MATSMERDSEKHVTKTRRLTPKQQVQALYPYTVSFFTGKQWVIWSEDGDKLFHWTVDQGNNKIPRQAWAHAWLKIQKRMIRKLES